MPDAQETVLEINLDALKANFNYLKSRVSSKTLFLAVVKAFAYGHDAIKTSKFLEKLGVDYFAVAYAREGIALREAGIMTPILVLHPQPVNFSLLIDNCLEPSLYNTKVLRKFIEVSENLAQENYPVHIKFNTGLNRLGFWESDVNFILKELSNTNSIRVKSVFSHLAASEDLKEKAFSIKQIESFKKSAHAMTEGLGYKPILHMCNTSGLLNFPDAHFDMVRCGIGLYGFGNSKTENEKLKPIARLKSVISQIHKIEDGESVGYNRAFRAKGFARTATIPIGHADGIGRQYGNEKGFVFIRGKRAPIVGNVCMDMIMVDITSIECNEGDEVIIYDAINTAENLAEHGHTISYELLTAISPRVRRLYIGDIL